MEKYGFVYIWYDKKYKKYYIGSHWGHENDGYICSSKMMRQSYNRRPRDFKRRIIKRIYSNKIDLLIEEEKWLKMIDPEKTTPKNTTNKSRKNVRYYNIRLGTQNQWWSNDGARLTIGQKISHSKKGKSVGPCSPEKAQKISQAKKENFEKRKNETGSSFSPETIEKMSLSRKGKKHTEEWKKNNSELLKKQWSEGIRKSQEFLSESTKQKISESLKNNKIKRTDEHKNILKELNSKNYIIEYYDGTICEIFNLKKFSIEKSIPYITLNKASIHGNSIKKYNIRKIYNK